MRVVTLMGEVVPFSERRDHEPMEQGSHEWLFARAGKPTASQFHRILTPAKLDLSKGAKKYALECAIERMFGAPLDMSILSKWMERGNELEAEARKWYAMQRGFDVEEVGFVLHETHDAGGSPDGLAEDHEGRGGCEIKCRNAANHAATVLGWEDIATVSQVQGNIWVTGSDWWDQVAYCPGLPNRIQRTYPDPAWQQALDVHVPVFLEGVERARMQLEAIGEVRFDEDLEGQLQASIDALYGGSAA